ncbi:DMT family transporter [Methanolapillus millepedarum]|uniref:EamA domain-containing protein n=1 Tax=Methanolapillus millepedarum TaxID=3028296 RepID=A0AA96ZUR6_9EURY|nr:hypothetical protein MsAc7_16020 [Methanosarcinaceae archaeon Ac7]
MDSQKKADLLMFMVVFFWGLSYLFTRAGVASIPIFNFIALRFAVGFIVALLLFFRHFSKINSKTIRCGVVLGFLLFLTLAGVNYGIQHTTISNVGFLGSLTVIFVPIMSSVAYRKFPEKKIIAASICATIGIGLMTLEGGMGVGLGDLVCVLAAIVYSTHIMLSKRFVEIQEVDPLNLGIVQLGFTALFGLIFSLVFEDPFIPSTVDLWIPVLFLGVFCSAFGFIAQVVAQKYTTPSHIGLIFALEPVFAALFAYLFASEHLLPIQYLGAAIVFVSVVLAELLPNKKEEKN